MKRSVSIDKTHEIGSISKYLFGSFIEHMGRCVYGGIYEPDHPLADEFGYRKDVLQLVKDLSVPILRYPGGNFVSGYDWKDGIGSVRTPKLDLAWAQMEPNTFGLHEFMRWCEKVGSEILMSVNMGTGSCMDAAQLVEYCNVDGGGKFAEMRKRNGREKPFNIKRWCLGNEMDGSWQICAMTATEYARKATETAKMMKMVDPSIMLSVCGSSSCDMPTFPEWDRIALEHTYDYADYLSLHRYYTYTPSGRAFDFMSCHADLDRYVKSAVATADYVKAVKRSSKKIMLSLDEWNVWHTKPMSQMGRPDYEDSYDVKWKVGIHRLENVYDLTDAVAFAGMACAMINNADRIGMGCLAQLVNVIAPIMTEDGGRCFRQTTYYPYKTMLEYAKGVALDLNVQTPTVSSDYGDVGEVYCACAYDNGRYSLFVINKTDKPVSYDINFAVAPVAMKSAGQLFGTPNAYNDFDAPDRVTMKRENMQTEKLSSFTVVLQPTSFTHFVFEE